MGRRSSVAALVVAGVLGIAGTAGAQGLPHDPPRAAGEARPAVSGSREITVEGTVIGGDGSPVAGAVVVTSAGGEAVTNAEGRYAIEIRLPHGADVLHVSAFGTGAGKPLASAAVSTATSTGRIPVGPLALSTSGTCEPSWLPTFGGRPGFAGFPEAMVVHDDGTGPALYVGGNFSAASGVAARGIARWDGVTWSALGSGVEGVVVAMTVFDDGSGPALIVGGSFSSAGGVPAKNIARWDGSSWSEMGSAFNSVVLSLTTVDDGGGQQLFAGGSFTSGGLFRVAGWDGSTWTALGSGSSSSVSALSSFDDGTGVRLYAAGSFDTGGTSNSKIASWDGATWSAVGTGSPGARAMAVFDDGTGPALYVGGDFDTAGGVPAENVARWDGTAWSAVGSGTEDSVRAMTVYDDGTGSALYVGGDTGSPAGGATEEGIRKWDGTAWSGLAGGIPQNSDARALAGFDDGNGPRLFMGGDFDTAGGVEVSHFGVWDGTSWSTIGSGLTGNVEALTVHDDGTGAALYVGGWFTTVEGLTVNGIARWDGSSWSPLGTGVAGAVFALASFDDGSGPALYVGGNLSTAGGAPVGRVARWDGSTWSALGSGVNSTVRVLHVHDDGSGPALFAGGSFNMAGGAPAGFIARWDGTSWSPLGSGVDDSVWALETYDDGNGPGLYASGAFVNAGGVSARKVARWDGSAWSPLGSGVGTTSSVRSLEVFDDGSGEKLYVGGAFFLAGGVLCNNIAAWDGTSWSALGDGTDQAVTALAALDDGTGPRLFAATSLDDAGGVPAAFMAAWDGSDWSALGSGVLSTVLSLTSFDDGGCGGPALYVGGSFLSAVDSGDSYLARWGCDDMAPVLTCAEDITVECAGSAGTVVDYDVSAVDLCDPGPVVVAVPPSGSAFPHGTTSVTVTATDAAGNASRCSFDVIVVDTIAPDLTCPADVVTEGTSPAGAVVTFTPAVSDLCDPAPAVVAAPPSGSTFPLGDTAVTVFASDAAGNTTPCTFTVTVEDTTAPVIDCPSDMTVECTGSGGTAVTFSPSVTDVCDPSPAVVCTPPSGSAFPVGTTTVTCTASDASGNTSMCTFDVTVEDTTPPVLTCPGSQVVDCAGSGGTVVDYSPSVFEVCDAGVSVVCIPPSGSLFPVGTTVVTCVATDASGNTDMCTFPVTVTTSDLSPPELTCPDDITVECTSPAGDIVTFVVTATDPCDPSPVVDCSPPSGSVFPPGTTRVTCTATDAGGNSSQCSFTVQVVDTTAPVITCPQDVAEVATGPVPVSFSPSVTDACDPSPSIVCIPPSGSVFPLGDTVVTCTATDDSGNASQCTFTVRVIEAAVPIMDDWRLLSLTAVLMAAVAAAMLRRA